MISKKTTIVVSATLLGAALLAGCGSGSNSASSDSASSDSASSDSGTGAIEVRANGEDFVRQGFTTKDGWNMTFDNVYVTLSDVTAYQADPAFDPDEGEEIEATEEAELEGTHTVDLAEGGADAETIRVSSADGASAGLYNALSWEMVPAESGPAEGSSVMVVGSAEKDGETVDFTLPVEDEFEYRCGEFVGEERKGVLEDGGTTDLEATFHFDHIFGDADVPADDDLNTGAVGFDPFAEVAQNGEMNLTLDELEDELSAEDYELLEAELPTLGHTGEGHCLETNSGSLG